MSENKKRVFNPEIKAKLKGLGGFNNNDSIEIVPSQYKEKKDDEYLIPKEFWPVFKFKYLNTRYTLELQSIAEKLSGDLGNDELPKVFDQLCGLIDTCIMSVSNFYNIETGEEIQIKDRKSIDYLELGLISDIAVQLVTKNKLTDEEREGLI